MCQIRFILIVVLMVVGMSVSAQETVPDTIASHRPDSSSVFLHGPGDEAPAGVDVNVLSHLQFKGIPIDGTIGCFGKSLVSKGFRQASAVSFIGPFAGVEETVVVPCVFSEKVWKVCVLLPPHASWSAVKEEYLRFKDQLAWKYVVQPSIVKEVISLRYREGSGQEMWGFETASSIYRSIFEFPDGEIVLFVTYDKPSGGMRVCIEYVDRVNELLKQENDMMDL